MRAWSWEYITNNHTFHNIKKKTPRYPNLEIEEKDTNEKEPIYTQGGITREIERDREREKYIQSKKSRKISHLHKN